MIKEFNSSGYNLYEIAHDEWILDDRNDTIVGGSFKDVIKYAISLGFNLEEIEVAVTEMVKREHNAAHFGGGRKFIYTFQKEFRDDGQKAS